MKIISEKNEYKEIKNTLIMKDFNNLTVNQLEQIKSLFHYDVKTIFIAHKKIKKLYKENWKDWREQKSNIDEMNIDSELKQQLIEKIGFDEKNFDKRI